MLHLRSIVIVGVIACVMGLAAACGGSSKPAPAAPEAPAAATPESAEEMTCCTIASAEGLMSSVVPLADCPEENRGPVEGCGE